MRASQLMWQRWFKKRRYDGSDELESSKSGQCWLVNHCDGWKRRCDGRICSLWKFCGQEKEFLQGVRILSRTPRWKPERVEHEADGVYVLLEEREVLSTKVVRVPGTVEAIFSQASLLSRVFLHVVRLIVCG